MSALRRELMRSGPVLALLLSGVLVASLIRGQRNMVLLAPLSELPLGLADYRVSREDPLADYEATSIGADDYVLRTYRDNDGKEVQVFVAFFGRQEQGVAIHSPRNCLPGSGWEPTERRAVPIEYEGGSATVNRYLVKHESGATAVVYYWYQGRGRVEANEYRVKWLLLRDSALRGRTDEALVRVVFPVARHGAGPSEADAGQVIVGVANSLSAMLPAG